MCELEEFVVKQGDQYDLPFLAIFNNSLLFETDIEKVEITIGDVLQKYLYITRTVVDGVVQETRQGTVYFDTNKNTFNFPLLQEESTALATGVYPTEIRVKMRVVNTGDTPFIFANSGPNLKIVDSLSTTILN